MKMLVVSNRVIENGQWFSGPEQLEHYLKTQPLISSLLFAFWSWKVPDWMLAKYKCYGMHTGFLTLGKGKGGSPIDNLQLLGIEWAQLNVFEMTSKFDEGRVILAIPLNLLAKKEWVIENINQYIPNIVGYLKQDISSVPERFKRIV